MPTLVEELIHVAATKFPSLSLTNARKRFQEKTSEMLKQDKLGRVLNNFDMNLHALNVDKFNHLKKTFNDIVQHALKTPHIDEETGFLILDDTTKSSIRSWIDEIVLEGCEMLLDEGGQLRKDIVNFLNWNKYEDRLNTSHGALMSYVQVVTEDITVNWQQEAMDNIGKESKNEEREKLIMAAFSSIQLFFSTYFGANKDYLTKHINEYVAALFVDVSANCASDLKEWSKNSKPETHQNELAEYILTDIQNYSSYSSLKEKLEFWIDAMYYSAGNGDYNSVSAFLKVFTKENLSLDDLSETAIRKHISCVSLLEYYHQDLITPVEATKVEDKKEIPEKKAQYTKEINQWLQVRDNLIVIDTIFEIYHQDKTLSVSAKPTAEKKILEELLNMKFNEDILIATDKLLENLYKQTNKNGRLAEVLLKINPTLDIDSKLARDHRSATLFREPQKKLQSTSPTLEIKPKTRP